MINEGDRQSATMLFKMVSVIAREHTGDSERHTANAQMLPGVLHIGLHSPAEDQIGPEALRGDLYRTCYLTESYFTSRVTTHRWVRKYTYQRLCAECRGSMQKTRLAIHGSV